MSHFRLKLKKDKDPPAPPTDVLKARPPREPPPKPSSSVPKTRKRRECHAFIEAYNKDAGKEVDKSTCNAHLPYVIVGRGFAATVNLATLLSPASNDRVEWYRPIVLVGYDDPWSKYVTHDMNQEVELLTLPGYVTRPALADATPDNVGAERWLPSNVFAATNGTEVERLMDGAFDARQKERVSIIEAGVAKIEPFGNEYGFYVYLNDGSTLLGRRVDVCTGTGQQRYMEAGGERGVNMSAKLWSEYLNPKLGDEAWKPRVASAEMYVTGTRQVIANGSVLISTANNPAGIQAGEHALGEDDGGRCKREGAAAAEVVLTASADMNGGFLAIGRLDGLARTPGGPLPRRLHTPEGQNLCPTRDALWFAETYRVVSIEDVTRAHVDALCHENDGEIVFPTEKLLVTLRKGEPKNGINPRIVRGSDRAGAEVDESDTGLTYGLFDQVVFSTGRARGDSPDKEEEGSALQLVWAEKGKLTLIEGPDFGVGLQAFEGAGLRILGAAGINNPIFRKLDKDRLARYERSLPVQARVNGEGVTLSAVTIAFANGFFTNVDGNRNVNVNTATRDELKKALGDAGGDLVFRARHWRVRPFVSTVDAYRTTEYFFNYPEYRKVEDKEKLNPRDVNLPVVDQSKEILPLVEYMNSPRRLIDDEDWRKNVEAAEERKFTYIESWAKLSTKVTQTKMDELTVRYAGYFAKLGDADKTID